MARKKGKNKPAGPRHQEADNNLPLGLAQALFSSLPEEVKQQLLSSLADDSLDDFPLPPPKPRTKALQQIDRLVQEARNKSTPSEAVPLLQRAEQMARKAIGRRFEGLVGLMGTNPAGSTYLSVKVELSQALRATGQQAEALAHTEQVYELDPDDPLDARFLMLVGYFDLNRLDDAERLLKEDCVEPWAAWNFGELLVELRRGKRGPAVDELLKTAHRHNPYVLSLLLNARMLDPELPGSIETGEDSEARDFAAYFLSAWKDTPGAISWLREAAARLKLDIAAPAEQAPPRRLSARDFAAMPPHEHSTWLVGLQDMGSSQLPGEEQPQNHWMTYAFSPENDLLGFDVSDGKPSARELWESLVDFMLDERQPGRPARLLVSPPALIQKLKKDADRAKIELAPSEHAAELSEMLAQLTERIRGGIEAAESLDPDVIRSAPLDPDEVWEAAVVQLDQRLSIAGQSLRPWVALVMSRPDGLILWHELFMEPPPAGALASAVRMAIARPAIGPSRRPHQVVVRDYDEAVSLEALKEEAGFECLAHAELPLVASAVSRLTQEFLGGEPEVVLTKSPGTTRTDLERFYTAAAAYFRAQPWKRFAMDELVGLDVAGAPFGRRFALVMGQSGLTIGLAIYERLEDIESMFDSQSDGMAFDSFSVMFGEESSISPPDLDAIDQFGWPIATPEAYPDALRIHPGPRVETPTAEELRFLVASLEAIAWLAAHGDQKSTTVTVAETNLTATRLGVVGSVR